MHDWKVPSFKKIPENSNQSNSECDIEEMKRSSHDNKKKTLIS